MTSAAPTLVPPTPKQVEYARLIASKLNAAIPVESANDRRALSDWIGRQQARLRHRPDRPRSSATPKQVAFAERIARRKQLAVPDECFRDAGLMSHWIDSNRI